MIIRKEKSTKPPAKVRRVYAEWEDVQLVSGAKSEKRNPKLDLKQQETECFFIVLI